jgi:hypothetical protein
MVDALWLRVSGQHALASGGGHLASASSLSTVQEMVQEEGLASTEGPSGHHDGHRTLDALQERLPRSRQGEAGWSVEGEWVGARKPISTSHNSPSAATSGSGDTAVRMSLVRSCFCCSPHMYPFPTSAGGRAPRGPRPVPPPDPVIPPPLPPPRAPLTSPKAAPMHVPGPPLPASDLECFEPLGPTEAEPQPRGPCMTPQADRAVLGHAFLSRNRRNLSRLKKRHDARH